MHRTSVWKIIEVPAARYFFGQLCHLTLMRVLTTHGQSRLLTRRASCRNLLFKKLQTDRQIRFASSLPDASNSKAGDDVENLSPLSPEPWSTDVVVDHSVVEHVTGPSSDGPVGAAMSLIDGLHSVTGLPWWATLSVTALGDDPPLLLPPPTWCLDIHKLPRSSIHLILYCDLLLLCRRPSCLVSSGTSSGSGIS